MLQEDDRKLIQQRHHQVVFSMFPRRACNITMGFFALFLFCVNVKATNPCSGSQFWVVATDGTHSCVECEGCPPGQGLSHECGNRVSADAMVKCVPCHPGASFSSEHDTSSCVPCASCSEDQVVLQKCTPAMNVKCARRCYSKDRYYDENGDCVPCSKCCGDGQDVTKDECRQKLGEASKRICSFSSNISRCSTITSTPKQTNTMSGKKKLDTKLIAVSVSVSSVVVGLIVVIAACRYRCFSSRRCSCLWHESSDEAEIGIQFCQYAVNDPKQSVVQSSQVGVVDKRETVSDKVLATESCQPLSSEESAVRCKENASNTSTTTGQHKQHNNNKKDSKPLSSLLEHECILQRVCEVLDTPLPGRGHFKAVAQHYGFDHYQIESVLKKFDGGPSRALIESLAASHTELTVQEFADVVKKTTNRNDVLKLLIAYEKA